MVVKGQLHALAVLPPWKEPHHPLDRKLGGPLNWYGCGHKGKIPTVQLLRTEPWLSSL